ncbi:MAG: methylmalonyl Co-A mutase-associated GTPase MeaB [Candidatus Zixiibacteriota bacterium]|nr:MAG: methylmalonyl Co-A mutase-associated GTPase MeaB [candidate division Zixibacteria bacterium]
MGKKQEKKSALSVKKGVVPPANINSTQNNKNTNSLSADELFSEIRAGDRSALGKAITLIESTQPKHIKDANRLIEKCLPISGNSFRIGITGVPGVGKSTFIEQIGLFLLERKHKVAVLAVDPSSTRSKGSILGDKTRMEKLSAADNAFIRPSPSAGSLGGVARKTRETIMVCEAAGYDYILIETVGVGQSETVVRSMVDFFLLLMLAGAGDELQGIKRGIIEMADLIAINKTDGDNIAKANLARQEYQNALHLFPQKDSKWQPPVLTCSAVTGKGIDDIFQQIENYQKQTFVSGFFKENRKQQAKYWLDETIWDSLKKDFLASDKIKTEFRKLEQAVLNETLSPFAAAQQLLDLYKTGKS